MAPKFTAAVLSQIVEELLGDPDNKYGGNLLGTYTDSDGNVIAAVTIGNPGPLERTEGLEVVIPLEPVRKPNTSAADGYKNVVARWDILLIQHDLPPLYRPALPEAVDRLDTLFRFAFGGETSSVFVDGNEMIGSYPQCRFTFTSDQFVDIQSLLSRFPGGN